MSAAESRRACGVKRGPYLPWSVAGCSLAPGHAGHHEVHSVLGTLMFSWPKDGTR